MVTVVLIKVMIVLHFQIVILMPNSFQMLLTFQITFNNVLSSILGTFLFNFYIVVQEIVEKTSFYIYIC